MQEIEPTKPKLFWRSQRDPRGTPPLMGIVLGEQLLSQRRRTRAEWDRVCPPRYR
jgi:hypothetical protein